MKTIQTSIERFLQQESAAGILLMMSAVLAMIVANSPLNVYYNLLLDTPVEVTVGKLEVAKPLLLWINDGLMAIFFFIYMTPVWSPNSIKIENLLQIF